MKLYKSILFIYIFFQSINIVYSKSLIISGNERLSYEDIQTLTTIDIFSDSLNEESINSIIKDLYTSELIDTINLSESEKAYNIQISETKIINEIYFNGNLRLKDELLKSSLSIQNGSIFKKSLLENDIDNLKLIYASKGFNNAIINVTTELFSQNKINIIFQVTEKNITKLKRLIFKGNNTFSYNQLSSRIQVKPKGIISFISSANNFDEGILNFDKNKLISFYKKKGFFDTKVEYLISQENGNVTLTYYISEGKRYKINNLVTNNDPLFDKLDINNLKDIFIEDLSKNNNFYDQNLIDSLIDNLNILLISQGYYNKVVDYQINNDNDGNYLLSLVSRPEQNKILRSVKFSGNNVTKNKTLFSKLEIEPGDFIYESNLNKTKEKIERLKYVDSVNINSFQENEFIDLEFDIDENSKSGNFLIAGSVSGDTGLGFNLGLSDFNFLGTGNELDTSFNINEESTFFNVSLTSYPISNSKIKNVYSIFNDEKDLTGSFGFKSREIGMGYNILFEYNDNISVNGGFVYKSINGHSATNSSISSISDNIGNFDDISLTLGMRYDTLNDFLFPTQGYLNSFSLNYTPEGLSDNSRYEIYLKNNNYIKLSEYTKNYAFLFNNYSKSESLNSNNLKTVNALSLGGLNFKGFDYRGIGPFDSNIYLGGNESFTSTVGYGGSFIFDESDNVMFKVFYTTGSLWGSDYQNSDFELRSSAGISLDFITPIAPISLTYAVPIEKNTNDKVKNFNFTIGTSF